MRLLHNKLFAIVYWLVAFVATVFAAVLSAGPARDTAPEFGDEPGAGAGSEIIFALGGALLGAGATIAVFAGIWLGAWAYERRSAPAADDGEYGTFDDFDDEYDEGERDDHPSSFAADNDEHTADSLQGYRATDVREHAPRR